MKLSDLEEINQTVVDGLGISLVALIAIVFVPIIIPFWCIGKLTRRWGA